MPPREQLERAGRPARAETRYGDAADCLKLILVIEKECLEHEKQIEFNGELRPLAASLTVGWPDRPGSAAQPQSFDELGEKPESLLEGRLLRRIPEESRPNRGTPSTMEMSKLVAGTRTRMFVSASSSEKSRGFAFPRSSRNRAAPSQRRSQFGRRPLHLEVEGFPFDPKIS